MRWIDYIKDKAVLLLMNMSGIMLLSCFLLLTGNSAVNVALILVFWMVVLIVWIAIDYKKRQAYFNHIFQVLEELDKRYLIAEVTKPAERLDDRLYYDILRKSNKHLIHLLLLCL